MDLTVVDSFTDRPFAGNPAAVAVVDAFPDEHAHAGHRPRDEPVGDGLRRAPGRRLLRPALVHPHGRGRPVRARHAGRGARARRGGHVPHQERRARVHAGRRRLDRDGLPRRPRHRRAAASRRWRPRSDSTDGGREHARPRRVRLRPGPRRRLVELADAATVRALRPDMAGVAALGSRCVIVTAAGRPARDRLCEPRVRPQRRHPRGSRHRLGALHAGRVLGGATRTRRARGRAGLGPRRHGAHAAPGTASCSAVRPSRCRRSGWCV